MKNNRFKTALVIVIALASLLVWPKTGFGAEGDVTDPATQIPVLMYHGLLTEAENKVYRNNSSIISVENFKEQMQFLAKNGYHTVTVDEMNAFIAGKIQLPRKSVMIQFDDGLRSVYRYAFPVMQAHGLHGVANIITSRIDKENKVNWNPDTNQYMNHEMLNAISSVFDLESHTNKSHYLHYGKSRLMFQTSEFILGDLLISREKLSRFNNATLLAYPFGQFDSRVIKLAKESGFSMAFTTNEGYVKSWDSPYRLNRIAIHPKTSISEFKEIVMNTVEPIFKDIPLSHPNFEQTFWLYSHHIIKGYPDGYFGSNQNITRAQSAKMLVQALGVKIPEHVEKAPFSDIPLNYKDSYLVKAVTALKEAHIFNGDHGMFNPESVLTREQMATVLVNTYKWDPASINVVVKDLDQADKSHKENILILAQEGVTTIPNGNFLPDAPTRRLHLASFLYKAMHLK